ncbi:MAG: PEP/pyruvate-binding domain-containing protein, partial [Acidobacteria bacterium]|nr:PEP/pyruvate-binding domain-containing protein [Acidobacteriota bacterium]
FYTRAQPPADEGPFLKEERKLIDTIAAQIADFAVQRGLAGADRQRGEIPRDGREWPVIVEFLRRTDPQQLARISHRMINHLSWTGVEEAQAMLASYASTARDRDEDALDDNRPLDRAAADALPAAPEDIFALAAEHISGREILSALEKWIRDEKSSFLIQAVDRLGSTIADITDALDRFEQLKINDEELSRATRIGLRVALARRLLTDDSDFVNLARTYLTVSDYTELLHRVIAPTGSHGKLGGKSAGLLLAAGILRTSTEYADLLEDVRVPRTSYVASDALLDFVEYNRLEDVYNRKYLEIDQIRRNYPHMVQVFKHSHFSPEIVRGLSVALDDFQDRPLIVRSSSLLEDRMGAAFSGKYKSLFLANQGTKRERLGALLDAVAEVYASLFGPDPIEYRAERGLLDFQEEMAVMIQEVVGARVGRYFLPAYAGVAFSNNELRWSPRIQREDGLVRIVPGLGTRAVDRLSDDYPVLLAPGQPGLQVNVTADEVMRYSPRRIDLINLEARRFETMEIGTLLAECGRDLPAIGLMLSIVDPDGTRRPAGFDWEVGRQPAVVTFDALVSRTPFLARLRALLRLLREKSGGPVDIEFASDGRHLYLLQCRAQSFAEDAAPAPIPRDVPKERILFTANRSVSNGHAPDITHIVYVAPDRYQALGSLGELREVGRIVGQLNALLPKRQFVLIGPGRWGSREDIKLGVSVTYSDISNTAMLLEVARQRGNYVPDLSFGTHFFQDLVESGIRYLPLYPDDPKVTFNETFFQSAPNLLREMLPERAHLADVVHVIDVSRATGGLVLRILMNADLDEAIGLLVPPESGIEPPATLRRREGETKPPDHWRWRLRMAERIAAETDSVRFGVRGMYVLGSTKNATASAASDIDLLVHVGGTDEMRRDLLAWLEGWSRCLSEINYLRTGCVTTGLLDIHVVTDEDIARRTSWAAKIGAVTDAARPLTVGTGRSDARECS